ncbi:MAG TPA: POTRA domain-containing protein [Verrucomicrobiae bacterium]|nr:POTRA domain-containing protein [Verrucomicrobiae bacterium]
MVLLLLAQWTNAVAAPATNAPIVPTFQISRYEINGSSVLDAEAVERAMQGAIGTNVTTSQIRAALTRLQQAFRDRGYLQTPITLPRQPLTNGVIRLDVVEGPNQNEPAQAPTALPAAVAPAYNFEHFEIYGNSALKPEEIDRLLSPVAGNNVTVEQIEKALTRLQATYRERGYYGAVVKLPEQVLTDGTVVIKVEEGLTLEPEAALAAARLATNNPPPPPARTFAVQRYDVVGNTLLPQAVVDAVVTNGIGTNITFAQVQKVLGELQLAYRERGFISAKVSLPQQQITNATIRIQVLEGVLVDARVTGNRYFSSNNVMRALPTIRDSLIWKDQVINSTVLQREVDLANQNRDRTIYPIINPGPEPGTSALELRIKDRLPLHGRLEVNNQATPGTPDWRLNASANYNNLWQREHSIGVFYGFTPEEFKSPRPDPDYFFNRPLVANFGAYYRIPFGDVESVQQRIIEAGSFGYDEATKQFHPPPAGGRPDFTFSVSGSSSDTGVTYGPATVVSQTPLLTIVSQDTGQELTINQGAGMNLNLPKVLSDTRRLNFSAGLDLKYNEVKSYNTNNFIITTVVTNSQGSQIIESRVSSPHPTRVTEITYLPFNLGFTFSDVSPRGTFSGNLIFSANVVGNNQDFIASAYSPDAKPEFGKAQLFLNYDWKLRNNWSLWLRANGQAATGPLISNEQFALGGINSVRGYYEGDVYGDCGWFGSVELRAPYLATDVAVVDGVTPVWLRGSLFVDAGQAFNLDDVPGLDQREFLWSTGFGLSANINNRVDVKIAVAWPLAHSPNTEAYQPRAMFSLGGQF